MPALNPAEFQYDFVSRFNACRQRAFQMASRCTTSLTYTLNARDSAPVSQDLHVHRRVPHLAAAAALAALCGSVHAAQSGDQKPRQEQRPTFRTEANFVRVDAYPTKSGIPVLDLRAEDFELFEDGVLQKLETFEHVVVRPAGPQTERIEPGSQREMLQAAANPRNRVFVIFLDAPHVDVAGSHDIAEPLIKLINRILGPDDLVGIMTPAMSTANLVLARKTEVTEEQLRRHWPWGRRFSKLLDERETAYDLCYPPLTGEHSPSKLAGSLIQRKRERATLEALEDLVRYLRSVREERKAILTVTEGWLLFREDHSLMNLRQDNATGNNEGIPGRDPIVVGPDGKLTTKDPRNFGALTKSECDADRMRLAMMDNERYFRDILDQANRSNASFYPIDPRGLPAFDNPIGPDPPPPPHIDQQMLKTRHEALLTMALNTDGLAVVNSNDLDRGLRQIADDLTSYYLLGYYSSNPKLDGRFRSIKVRVKRPGVDVRARRGYRAPTTAEVNTARAAAAAPVPEAKSVVNAALGALGRIRPDARFSIYAAADPDAGLVWVAGELPVSNAPVDEWAQGVHADLQIIGGAASTTARVILKPGERAFLTSLKAPAPETGELDVTARLASIDRGGTPVTDTIRVRASRNEPQPLLFRRGPSTGNRLQPAADLRFSRTERLHIEIPAGADSKPAAGRLLDREGRPLALPVTTGERVEETTGRRWMTADVTLAPLAPGDYAVEVGTLRAATELRVVVAIRVVR
jgi:VWFA-related protein